MSLYLYDPKTHDAPHKGRNGNERYFPYGIEYLLHNQCLAIKRRKPWNHAMSTWVVTKETASCMGGRIPTVVGKSKGHYATILAFKSWGTNLQERKKMHVTVLVASTIKLQRIGALYSRQGSEIHCQHRGEADVEEGAAYLARYLHYLSWFFELVNNL